MATSLEYTVLILAVHLMFIRPISGPISCDDTTYKTYCGERLTIDETLYAYHTNQAQISGNWSGIIHPNTEKLSIGPFEVHSDFRKTDEKIASYGTFKISIQGEVITTSAINITVSPTQFYVSRIGSPYCRPKITQNIQCDEILLEWDKLNCKGWTEGVELWIQLQCLSSDCDPKEKPMESDPIVFSSLQKGTYKVVVTSKNACGETTFTRLYYRIPGCVVPSWLKIASPLTLVPALMLFLAGSFVGCFCKSRIQPCFRRFKIGELLSRYCNLATVTEVWGTITGVYHRFFPRQ